MDGRTFVAMIYRSNAEMMKQKRMAGPDEDTLSGLRIPPAARHEAGPVPSPETGEAIEARLQLTLMT